MQGAKEQEEKSIDPENNVAKVFSERTLRTLSFLLIDQYQQQLFLGCFAVNLSLDPQDSFKETI